MGMWNGIDYEVGSFTVPDTETQFTLNFHKTFNSYVFMIEPTNESKTTIVNSGGTYAKGYCYLGVYPERSINNIAYSPNIYVMRYIPSTGVQSNGTVSGGPNFTNSSMTFGLANLTDSGWGSLVRGLTYNYYIYPIES